MWSALQPARRALGRLRRRLLLHRRLLAALAAGSAVFLGIQAAAPPPPPSVAVWTASRDLSAGEVLHPDDLLRVAFTPDSVPAGVIRDPREVVGRTLAGPVSRGEPLTRLRTVGPGLLRGYPGTAAVPLRITDGDAVDLLRVGDEISIVVADPDGRQAPQDLVEDVPVVAIPRPDRGPVSDTTPGRLVVVAVPRSEAVDVAARAAAGILIPVWSR